MLTKKITYTDFDGNVRTETFMFNLNQSELIKMNYGEDEGTLKDKLERCIDRMKGSDIMAFIDKMIMDSYGEKSLDGKAFIKIDANGQRLSTKFAQTGAYDALFLELVDDPKAAKNFMLALIPQSLAEQIEEEEHKKKAEEEHKDKLEEAAKDISKPITVTTNE